MAFVYTDIYSMFLFAVAEALQRRHVHYAVAGGYAVAIHQVPRLTLDIDIVVNWSKVHLKGAEAAMRDLGLVSRLPITAEEVFEFRDEYIAKRNLVAWSFINPSDPSQIVDILIPHDLSKLRTDTVTLGGRKIRVLAIRTLIDMKKKSGRPQDLEDAAALEKRL